VDDLGELVRSGFSERVVHVNTVPSVAAKLLAGRALPPSVRVVTFAGEVLPQDLVRRVMASPGVEQVWNLYGPSEDTTFSTAALCRDRDDAAVPIGRPIRGSQAYVLNEVREPVAVGVRGELHLGGAGLARGYLGLPELTAERFMVNPLDAPSSRLYRTGDIAAWREDGQLEFHGRRDDQVKLRGFRIELEEIRRALLADARLSDAAVALRDEDGRASLAAYVVPTGGETVHLAELRRGLADRLPSHAMPASIVVLDTLPLSPNGKLDLRALAQPTPPPRPARAASLLERELAELWRVMLGLREPPSLDTDFFRCGGDSLDALSLMIAIEDRWRVRLPASAILRAATVTEMAAAIAGERAPTSEHIVPLAVGGPKSPWFCVVAHHEYALGLRRELPGVIGDRSAYSLALLPSGFSQAELDVEALATVGVAQLIAQQPTGPYLLGGYSLGGATAWEMACRLTAAGEEVAQLIIIDTRAPHLCRWLGDVSARARALATRDTVGRLRGCAGILRVSISRSRSWLRAQGAPPITSASQVPIELANSVLAAYTPPRFDGSVVVFRTDATARAAGIETLGWDRHASRPVATRWASGNHFTVLGREQARSLSFDLREVLDRTGL